MSFTRIAIVTGANKGIGYAIVRNIALDYPKSPLNNGPLLIYLTARSKERGEEAVESMGQDAQLASASALARHGGLADIRFAQLDVADKASIDAFGEFLKKEHPDGIDIVVNNAGVAMDGFDNNVVETTLATNYYGTLAASQTLLAQLRPGGRLVNVSSMMGALGQYPEGLRAAFRGAQSVADVSALMGAFTAAVAAGTEEADGWPRMAYAVSKAGCTAVTRVLARDEAARGRGVLVNACCPGWVATTMTKGRGYKQVDQGAVTPVLLAIGEIGGVTGEFWQDEKVSAW